MFAVQTGSNWWIDQLARFPGNNLGTGYVGGVIHQTGMAPMNADDADPYNSVSVTIAGDQEDEQISVPSDENDMHGSAADMNADQTESNNDTVVIFSARRTDAIAAIIRPANVDEQETHGGNDHPGNESFKGAMLTSILKKPAAAVAATTPNVDAATVFSLLEK